MTAIEVNTFIETMEEVGDIWSPEDVQRVYGEDTLENALDDRRSLLNQFNSNIAAILSR